MEKIPKIPITYHCELCNLMTYSFKDYNKHMSTRKHQIRTLSTKNVLQIPEKFICNTCNKCYKARNSLWYHQQKCTLPIKDASNNYIIDKDLVMLLIKENSELKNVMMEFIQININKCISKEILVEK